MNFNASEDRDRSSSNLVIRMITGLILGIGSLVIMYLSRGLFALEVALITTYGLRELYKVTGVKNPWLRAIGYLGGWCATALAYSLSIEKLSTILLLTTGAILTLSMIVTVISTELQGRGAKLGSRDYLQHWNDAITITFSHVYIAIPFSLSVALARDPNLALLLMLSVFTVDIFAYFGGKLLGRRLITRGFFNTLSPNKTWEGAIIGTLASWLVSYLYIRMHFPDKIALIPISWLVAIIASLSDLAESTLKRAYNIKDTDSVIFGHGGVLDRFDSYTLSAWLFWTFLLLLRLQ